MDDTSIQFRLRMAQINGINLDEADKKSTNSLAIKALNRAINPKQKDSKGSEWLKKQDDSYHNMERASALTLYHDEMRNNIRNGQSSNRAHNEAMKAVHNEHGQSGIDHIDQHYFDMTGSAPGRPRGGWLTF